MEPSDLAGAIAAEPAAVALDLLVLHGSRARGEATESSDWDFGFLARPGETVDPVALVVLLARSLGTDAVDVVDLARASALLRFRAARDGVVVVERRPERFLEFREEAVRFWCDAGPVIRAAQAEVLAGLG